MFLTVLVARGMVALDAAVAGLPGAAGMQGGAAAAAAASPVSATTELLWQQFMVLMEAAWRQWYAVIGQVSQLCQMEQGQQQQDGVPSQACSSGIVHLACLQLSYYNDMSL